MEFLDICIDFDGTCVSHDYPKVGKDIGSIPVLKELIAEGHRLILFTMRPFGEKLTDAVNWFSENDIKLYSIQKHPDQGIWTNSPKAQGDLYIDDSALGIPLISEKGERPYVDWVKTRELLVERGLLK